METQQTGFGRVGLSPELFIVCTLGGDITLAIVQRTIAETREYADQLRQQGKRPRLLIDVSQVRSQDSGSRSAAKSLRSLGLEKIAVCGASKFLGMVGQYIIKAGGMSDIAKMFKTREEAEQWLINGTVVAAKNSHFAVGLLLTVPILLATATLIGWASGEPLLYAISTDYHAMNPVTALMILLFVVTLALFIAHPGRVGNWAARAYAAASGLFGLFVLLSRIVFNSDLPVDTWLFGKELTTHALGRVTIITAIITVLSSVTLGLLTLSGKRQLQRLTFRILHGFTLFALALIIISYVFNIHPILIEGALVPMPLNTALAFMGLNLAYFFVDSRRVFFEPARLFLSKYWGTVFVCYVLVLFTGIAWQQTRDSVAATHQDAVRREFLATTNAISGRLQAYTNSITGFKAFFESSTFVDDKEYRNYFVSSGVAKNYPGFSAITFIRSLPTDQQAASLAEIRSIPGYETFALRPEVPGDEHYGVLFVQPTTPTTSYGFDLASDSSQVDAFHRARDSGKPAASSLLNLNISNQNAPVRNGFFLTVPVYTKQANEPRTPAERKQRLYGFVNAVFQNSELFADLFSDRTTGAHYTVTAGADKQDIYTTGEIAENQHIQQASTLKVADTDWRLTLRTSDNFGVGSTERWLPHLVLIGGGLLTVLAGFVVLSQSRRREQAVRLAAHMTEDLNNERTIAVSLQQKDEAILRSIGDAVFAVDTKGIITLFNPVVEQLSGFSRSEAVGKHYSTVLSFVLEKTGETNKEFIAEALAGHTASMKNHTFLVRRDGVKIPVADSAAPIRDGSGAIMGAIIVFRDVSKEYELDRAKTEFVSMASHQLRTPLAGINWFSEMLLGGDAGPLNKEQTEYITEMRDGNQRMLDLVNSLLDVSRLDLGKLTNKLIATPMVALVDSVRKELQVMILQKKLQVKVEGEPNLPPVVADPKLLRMIVQNLLSNAVKYTPANGMVTVTMHSENVAGIASLYMTIADTGYGIPKEQQPKIFGKLFRADNVQRLDIEGNGLGLYIVKEVVEKLGGHIRFESTEGQGTTFFVSLPFQTKTAANTEATVTGHGTIS